MVDASQLKLPAVNLTYNCYANMFFGCSELIAAPELPSTSLAEACYRGMFYSCSSLQKAPELLAPILPSQAYFQMFDGCSSINYVKALCSNPDSDTCGMWLNSASSEGTFVKHPNTVWEYGGSGIPDGWTVEDANI